MPEEGNRWRHVIISTLNSWLPGSPKGFRAINHKIHSSGDYRKPPPTGEHAGLYKYSKQISGDPVVIPKELRETIGIAIRDELNRLSFKLLVISVASTHCHIQVEFPDDKKLIRKTIGECKRKASVANMIRLIPRTISGTFTTTSGTNKKMHGSGRSRTASKLHGLKKKKKNNPKPHHERSDWWGYVRTTTPTNRCAHGGA